MESKEKNRIILIFAVFTVLFVVVLAKAFYVQVINRNKLIAYSKKQILRTSTVYPHRGNILDRNGFPLAINVQTYSIFTIPKNVKGKGVYRKLSKIIPKLSLRKIKKKIHKRQRYTWLARKISLTKEQAEKVKGLSGVYIEAVPKRFYPNHELLSQALGFVGIDNVGLAGLEHQFDELLRGKPQITKYLQDAKGRPIKFETQPMVGEEAEDLTLTIDKDLQAIAEKALKDMFINSKSKRGGIGVMDAETGEIWAIANYPTFDPNKVSASKEKERKLSFISDPIEPGSVFKLFTVASTLEHKVAKPDTNYYCERGKLKVGDHIINEAEMKKKHEWLNVSDIVKHSSNIGTTKIAFDLTFPKLKETLEKLGIGKKTNIELPGESRGIFTDKANITPLSLSNISFGQGVATTGIQILAAYAALANGGMYVKPTIIKKEEYPEGTRVISQETSDQLTEMLIGVVEDGTGTKAKIPHFKIAGKTSTAQRPGKNGGYSGYIPGFVGYPVNVERKFIIYVYFDDPQAKDYYGNLVAAPVFKKVAQYILYKKKEFNQLTVVKPDKKLNIFESVKRKNNQSRVIGKGKMPNFIGLDKVSANALAKQLSLKVVQKGIGIVRAQKPVAGTKLNTKSILKLFFAPPQYE
jgi:cell division protein FtsI (penicillin-binding protein 3)